MSKAKEMAHSALMYLDFDNLYEGGRTIESLQFGYEFATECVTQISNKIDTLNNVTIHTLDNEFKKLLKVTNDLNDSEFAFAIVEFKSALTTKSDKHLAIEKFLSAEHLNVVITEFYNDIVKVPKDKFEITKQEVAKYTITQPLKNGDEATVSSDIQKPVTEKLNDIPLEIVLKYMNASKTEDENKWKIAETEHNIAVLNKSWHDFNNNKSGEGPISLLAYHNSIVNNIIPQTKEQEVRMWLDARTELLIEFGLDLHLNKEQDKIAQIQVDKEESINLRFKM